MQFLWKLALSELIAARVWGLCGVSFAASDSELRWLYQAAYKLRVNPPRVVLINTGADVMERFCQAVGADASSVRSCQTVDQYIAQFAADASTRP
jgi:hypothetical protein